MCGIVYAAGHDAIAVQKNLCFAIQTSNP